MRYAITLNSCVLLPRKEGIEPPPHLGASAVGKSQPLPIRLRSHPKRAPPLRPSQCMGGRMRSRHMSQLLRATDEWPSLHFTHFWRRELSAYSGVNTRHCRITSAAGRPRHNSEFDLAGYVPARVDTLLFADQELTQEIDGRITSHTASFFWRLLENSSELKPYTITTLFQCRSSDSPINAA